MPCSSFHKYFPKTQMKSLLWFLWKLGDFPMKLNILLWAWVILGHTLGRDKDADGWFILSKNICFQKPISVEPRFPTWPKVDISALELRELDQNQDREEWEKHNPKHSTLKKPFLLILPLPSSHICLLSMCFYSAPVFSSLSLQFLHPSFHHIPSFVTLSL